MNFIKKLLRSKYLSQKKEVRYGEIVVAGTRYALYELLDNIAAGHNLKEISELYHIDEKLLKNVIKSLSDRFACEIKED